MERTGALGDHKCLPLRRSRASVPSEPRFAEDRFAVTELTVTAARHLRAMAHRHPLVLDATLGVALAGFAVTAYLVSLPGLLVRPLGGTHLAAAGVAALAVTARRLWPLQVLSLTVTATAGFSIVAGIQPPTLLTALSVLSYTVASRTARRTAWLSSGSAAVLLFAVGTHDPAIGWLAPQNVAVLAWIGMATAIGDATRSRREYVTGVEERAHRAEQTRDEEARRRVAEERLRIARELHDVVAHHIAVINVQAGAAGHVLHRRPEEAGPALAQIRRASDTVLRELASIVGVLRQPDDGTVTEPARGLGRLPDLIDSFAAAGLEVDHRQAGDVRDLSVLVDLAAYRIAQESLTNASKYGVGTARLTVAYTPDAVHLEVANTIGIQATGSGYGIIGMRERAAAAGGTLRARAERNGVFLVTAVLPAGDGQG